MVLSHFLAVWASFAVRFKAVQGGSERFRAVQRCLALFDVNF